MPITVPGGSTNVIVNGSDVLDLATQIRNALVYAQHDLGDLTVTSVDGSQPLPSPGPAGTHELVLSATGTVHAAIPSGYDCVVVTGSSPVTLTGIQGSAILDDQGGGLFLVDGSAGIASIAAVSGANTIQASGQSAISMSSDPEDMLVFAGGSGTVATGQGQNTVVGDGSGTGNLILSQGTDDWIVARSGSNTVEASGTRDVIFGGIGDLNVINTGDGSTIAGFGSNSTVSSSGADAMIVAGSVSSNINISGTNSTILGGSGPSTINASSDVLVLSGNGPLSFVGGTGTASIRGGIGESVNITVGVGGVLFAAQSENHVTIRSGAGISTIFGTSGSVFDFVGSQAGALFLGGAGNETMNAAGSSTHNTLLGGAAGGSNILMTGGSADDQFFAGTGSDTMTGGAGSDIFAFFANDSNGAHDYITDFTSNDSLYLIGCHVRFQ